MFKGLFNFYWIALTTARVLFLISLPTIFIAKTMIIPLIVLATSIGWSAILIAMFYKCPTCNKRALVHNGAIAKKIETNRDPFSAWLFPSEIIKQLFYCCKCGYKIEARPK